MTRSGSGPGSTHTTAGVEPTPSRDEAPPSRETRPPDVHVAATSVGGDAITPGRPRVFGVAARAIPISDDGGSWQDHGIDVALLMTPRPDEPFALRAPRGALGSGKRFVLRCPGLERDRGALARITDVSELGMHFDLVTAEIVRPGEQGLAPNQETTSGRRIAPSSPNAGSPQPGPEATVATHESHRGRLHQHASASAVQIGGVATIDADVSATLLSPVRMGQPVRLQVPRGEIPSGTYFAIRYFDSTGAKRGLVRAETVCRQPGMLDEIEATLIRNPTQAEERQSYRAPFDRFFTAENIGPNGARTLRGRLTDLSAGGIGFRATSTLAPGDQLRISDPSLPELDGAILILVRRDPRDLQRYGARFAEPRRGETTLAAILGLDRAAREHRRHAQIEAIRNARAATAAPLTDADIRTLRSRRMGTRIHENERGRPDLSSY
ncbi:MAG: hypothetical protein QOI43_670 [Gaiellales bacterium]|nr:hypothetical protein [Gaiellales bacterium]